MPVTRPHRLALVAACLLAVGCAGAPTKVETPVAPAAKKPVKPKASGTPAPVRTGPVVLPTARPSPTPRPTPAATPTPGPVTKGMPAPITLDAVRKEYGITLRRLSANTEYGGLRYVPIDAAEAEKRELMICQELALYPAEAARALPVSELILCKSIDNPETPLDESRVGGAAYTDGSIDALIYLADGEPHVLHHELYHAFDDAIERYDGTAAEDLATRWNAVNAPEFRYLTGRGVSDEVRRGHADGSLTGFAQGFTSAYGATAPGEDRAEVFATMMADPAKAETFRAASERSASKVKLIEEACRKLSPALGEDFWRRVRAAREAP